MNPQQNWSRSIYLADLKDRVEDAAETATKRRCAQLIRQGRKRRVGSAHGAERYWPRIAGGHGLFQAAARNGAGRFAFRGCARLIKF
jgi:hypothetical protein